MLFKQKKKKSSKLTIQEINITPLMDVLTVLLFFLIKIFTVNSLNINSPKDIKLPSSLSDLPPEEAVTILISANAISTPEQTLLKLSNGKIDQDQINPNSKTIKSVAAYLKIQMDKRNEIYKGLEDKSKIPAGKLLIHADQKIPFEILKYVLFTATENGYGDYQFLATKEQ